MKIDNLYENWYIKSKKYYSLTTYNNYVSYYNNHLKELIGEVEIELIDENLINMLIDKLIEKKLSNSTINLIIRILKAIVSFNNFTLPKIRYLKCERRVYECFSKRELRLIHNKISANMDGINKAILLAMYSGIRIGELIALRFCDIDNESIKIKKCVYFSYVNKSVEIIHKQPKSEYGIRNIPTHKHLKNMFLKDNCNYIVNDTKNVTNPRVIRYRFYKILDELDIKRRPFHYLRHTFATLIIEQTNDYKTVSQLLGHSSVAVTLDIYTHTNYKQKSKCINIL